MLTFSKISLSYAEVVANYSPVPIITACRVAFYISNFEDVPIGEGYDRLTTDFSLNVPSTKVKMGVELAPDYGFNAFLMLPYQNRWTSINGIPWSDSVDAFTLADIDLGYTFQQNFRLNLTVTNVFGEDYRVIYGAPKIGRQMIVKTYFDF